MAKKNKSKQRGTSIIDTPLMLNISLIFVIIGVLETVWVFDDWYFQPDYITDNQEPLFSGVLFIGLALMAGIPATYLRGHGARERYLSWLFLFFIAMAPLWSVGVCIMQNQTIARYKNPQFGVCYSQTRNGKTYMYVRNSEWCQHFGYTIARPSPANGEQ